MEGVGIGAGLQPSPWSPGCQAEAQLYSPICEPLRSLLLLNVLAVLGFGLICCRGSRGGWLAGTREKRVKESEHQLVNSQALCFFLLR